MHGIDAAALAAVDDWQFEPGRSVASGPRGQVRSVGSVVPVVVILQVEFSLGPNGRGSAAVPPVVTDLAKVTPGPPEAFANLPRSGPPGMRWPTLRRRVMANYTDEAMRAKIQGEVIVETVVQPDGTVGAVRVKKSLDAKYGLDDEALAVARRWRFNPAIRDGQFVAVVVDLILDFRLY